MSKTMLIVGILSLFIGTSMSSSTGFAINSMNHQQLQRDGVWLYVGGSGPNNFSVIQYAIDNASDGDTIYVYDDLSPYIENLSIHKSISLIGEDRYTTIIDGAEHRFVINVSADYVTILNLTIQNKEYMTPYAGLQILGTHCHIVMNNIIKNGHGILLSNSQDCNISDNYIASEGINIQVENADNTSIQRNTIEGKFNFSGAPSYAPGISILNSDQMVILDNTIFNNSIFSAIEVWDSCELLIDRNECYNNFPGILCGNCGNTSIVNNSIYACVSGILFYESSNNVIVGNSIIGNEKNGVTFEDECTQNHVVNNFIQGNKEHGLEFNHSCTKNNVYENNFRDNTYGLFISNGCNQNIMYYNSFVNNDIHAFDDSDNQWNRSYPSAGNYWDGFVVDDVKWGVNQMVNGSDGIGDIPYPISGGTSDMYPLMEPYGMTSMTLYFRGGIFRWRGVIRNIGNCTAFNVQWTMLVEGGIIFIGGYSAGIIPKPLLAGEETQIYSTLLVGFGKIVITVAVWADNAPFLSQSIPGTLLLFFIII